MKKNRGRLLDAVHSAYRYIKNDIVGYYKHRNEIKKLKGSKNIFMMGVPCHGNTGDQAIAEATYVMLCDIFPNYNITEINFFEVYEYIRCMKKYISVEDIIVCMGGGNMGVKDFQEEKLRRIIIQSFPNNHIIIFPQTVDFGREEFGIQELDNSVNIYSKHNKLLIFMREKFSYDIMRKKLSGNRVFLVPDIVLSLNEIRPSTRRGALLCFRRDAEKSVSDQEISRIIKYLQIKEIDYRYCDTVRDYLIFPKQRTGELQRIFDEFRTAEVVITDRLHGMIFSAITGTPCIALDNYNYKIKGVHQWLHDYSYIQYSGSKFNENLFNKAASAEVPVEWNLNLEFAKMKNIILKNIGSEL